MLQLNAGTVPIQTTMAELPKEQLLAARADEVEAFFHEKAKRIDELARARWDDEVSILATTALDALGAVWFCDFPAVRIGMERELGGKVPASIRMARLMAEFAPAEVEAQKVAVVCFAEDLARQRPSFAGLASQLLDPRVPDRRRTGFSSRALPHAYLDKPVPGLLEECPELRELPDLVALLEEYTYPALLYRFFRCPIVHMGSRSKRTHGFAQGREVMYMRIYARDITSFSFGAQLATDWIRSAATGYVGACRAAGHQPADVDAGAEPEANLERRWRRIGTEERP